MYGQVQLDRWLLTAFVSFLSLALFWSLPATSFAVEEVILTNGKLEYQHYCASCHGEKAKGDGPMAEFLVIKPVDLTQIRKRHKGRFPFWRLYRTIDGREEVRAHGMRAMPIWGSRFLTEEGGHPLNENIVIGRILGLVYYLESIQEHEEQGL